MSFTLRIAANLSCQWRTVAVLCSLGSTSSFQRYMSRERINPGFAPVASSFRRFSRIDGRSALDKAFRYSPAKLPSPHRASLKSPGRGFSLRGLFGGCVLAGVSKRGRAFLVRSNWSLSRNRFRSLRDSNLSLSAAFNFPLLLEILLGSNSERKLRLGRDAEWRLCTRSRGLGTVDPVTMILVG